MGDGLLTILFCLFCFAIAGLFPSILAFGGHDSLVQDSKERKRQTISTIEKSVEKKTRETHDLDL